MTAAFQLSTATVSTLIRQRSCGNIRRDQGGYRRLAGTGCKSKLGIGGEGLQNRPPYMKRSFWSLVAVQIQVLLNDNAAKLMLITLGAAVAPELLPHKLFLDHPEYAEMGAKQIKTILAAIIILPFILFAPTAGWISDRFSKRNVIVTSLWAQVAIMGMIGAALAFHYLSFAIFGLFLLGLQC